MGMTRYNKIEGSGNSQDRLSCDTYGHIDTYCAQYMGCDKGQSIETRTQVWDWVNWRCWCEQRWRQKGGGCWVKGRDIGFVVDWNCLTLIRERWGWEESNKDKNWDLGSKRGWWKRKENMRWTRAQGSPIGPIWGGVTCFTFNDCATITSPIWMDQDKRNEAVPMIVCVW